jgi:hypothetical protein
MNLSETCAPVTIIEQKLAERNVLIVESNALNTLRLSKKNSALERELAEEYYDFLDCKVFACDKEIYRVFYDELPADDPNRAEILDKIECEGVQLCTYTSKSELKVLQNPLIMNAEAYKTLSYSEKVERKIAEHNILDAGITNIITRSKSKKITEYEIKLLTAREYQLKGLILTCIKEIWRLDWDVIPEDAPDIKELNRKIEAINITKARYDSICNSRKKCEAKRV